MKKPTNRQIQYYFSLFLLSIYCLFFLSCSDQAYFVRRIVNGIVDDNGNPEEKLDFSEVFSEEAMRTRATTSNPILQTVSSQVILHGLEEEYSYLQKRQEESNRSLDPNSDNPLLFQLIQDVRVRKTQNDTTQVTFDLGHKEANDFNISFILFEFPDKAQQENGTSSSQFQTIKVNNAFRSEIGFHTYSPSNSFVLDSFYFLSIYCQDTDCEQMILHLKNTKDYVIGSEILDEVFILYFTGVINVVPDIGDQSKENSTLKTIHNLVSIGDNIKYESFLISDEQSKLRLSLSKKTGENESSEIELLSVRLHFLDLSQKRSPQGSPQGSPLCYEIEIPLLGKSSNCPDGTSSFERLTPNEEDKNVLQSEISHHPILESLTSSVDPFYFSMLDFDENSSSGRNVTLGSLPSLKGGLSFYFYVNQRQKNSGDIKEGKEKNRKRLLVRMNPVEEEDSSLNPLVIEANGNVIDDGDVAGDEDKGSVSEDSETEKKVVINGCKPINYKIIKKGRSLSEVAEAILSSSGNMILAERQEKFFEVAEVSGFASVEKTPADVVLSIHEQPFYTADETGRTRNKIIVDHIVNKNESIPSEGKVRINQWFCIPCPNDADNVPPSDESREE